MEDSRSRSRSSRRGGRRRGHLTIGRFDPAKCEWRDYEAKFRRAAERCGWDDDEKLDQLIAALEGTAIGVYTDNSSVDFDGLVELLNNRYHPAGAEKSHLFLLKARKLDPSESVADYAGELQRLARQAYPKMNKQSLDDTVAGYFMEGVQDEELKRWIAMLNTTDLEVLKATTVNFRAYEKNKAAAQGKAVYAVGNGTSNESNSNKRNRRDKNNRNSHSGSGGGSRSDTRGSSREERPRGCWYCGYKGHRWQTCNHRERECPNWKPGDAPRATQPRGDGYNRRPRNESPRRSNGDERQQRDNRGDHQRRGYREDSPRRDQRRESPRRREHSPRRDDSPRREDRRSRRSPARSPERPSRDRAPAAQAAHRDLSGHRQEN